MSWGQTTITEYWRIALLLLCFSQSQLPACATNSPLRPSTGSGLALLGFVSPGFQTHADLQQGCWRDIAQTKRQIDTKQSQRANELASVRVSVRACECAGV